MIFVRREAMRIVYTGYMPGKRTNLNDIYAEGGNENCLYRVQVREENEFE
jgi:hypothetical protein